VRRVEDQQVKANSKLTKVLLLSLTPEAQKFLTAISDVLQSDGE